MDQLLKGTTVIYVLTSSTELMELIKKVDAAFHSKSSESCTRVTSLHKFVPQIYNQLQDWEHATSRADFKSFYENKERELKLLKLFRDGADGGPQLLECFILQAERDNRPHQNLQYVDCLKSGFHSLFGKHVSAPQSHWTMQWLQSYAKLFKTTTVSGLISIFKQKGD